MTVPPITDAEAVKALDELATLYEKTAPSIGGALLRKKYERNAAAIRWALDLTAFPVDAPEGPNG